MLIGTDPEYILTDSEGFPISACNTRYDSTYAKIGKDGAGTPLEIRPDPTLVHMMEPFCQRMDNLLLEVTNYCENNQYHLFAGSWYNDYPIGGHIHFGTNKFIGHRHSVDERIKEFGKKVDLYFLPIINLFIFESDIRRRSTGCYGNLEDIRRQNYGIEYRTPYSFPISPFHNRAFFNIISLIAANHKKIKVDNELWGEIRQYYNGEYDNVQMKYIYKKIKPDLLKMMKYNSPNPKLNPYTLSLFSLIENDRMFNTLNVAKNYGAKPSPYLNIKISSDEFIGERSMREIFRDIKIEGKGKSLYIYGVGTRPVESDSYQIFLGGGMPPLENNRFVPPFLKVKYRQYGQAYDEGDYTIGLSWKLRRDIYNQVISPRFIVKYIKEQFAEVI